MTMSSALRDREQAKFSEGTGSKTGVSVLNLSSEFLPYSTQKTVTFAAGTTGATGTFKLADVTGLVAVGVIAKCGTSVTGTGTIEVGTALSTAALIAQTTGSDIVANEIWHDAAPDASVELTSVVKKNIVSQDINYKVTTNTLTAGVITFYIFWAPMSSDGNVAIA